MSGKVVRVIARITAQLDKVEELKSVLLGLVEPARLEKSCVSYQLVQEKPTSLSLAYRASHQID